MDSDSAAVSSSPRVLDTTLRDGLQAPGVVVGRRAQVAIARLLVQLGVPLLEVGIPAMGLSAVEDVRAVVDAIGGDRVLTWCRAQRADLAAAATTGAHGVHISFPVSAGHLAAWRRDRAWAVEALRGLAEEAGQYFKHFSVGLQDASRAEESFLIEFALAAAQAGARRIRLADTVGILCPERAGELMHRLVQACPAVEWEFHGHDDLGLATANALAAGRAGARWISTTVCGVGERAGNTALEQFAVAWERLTGRPSGLRLESLMEVCERTARLLRRRIPRQAPVIGADAFRHESGIHCAGLLRDRATYEPYPPQSVGRATSEFVIGLKSGRAAVAKLLEQGGVVGDADAVLAQVRLESRRRRRALSSAEVFTLAREVAGRAPASS